MSVMYTRNTKTIGCESGPVTDGIDDSVVESYGLCLTYADNFVNEKCIWVVDLKSGTKVFQDDDRRGRYTKSAWRRLGHYVADHPDNGIVAMRLRFGTHIIELPKGLPFYFYSKGLVQSITQTYGLDFHIVGWQDDTGQVLCTWFKVPELVPSEQSYRDIADCKPGQIIGSMP